jgi:hypothetical protein
MKGLLLALALLPGAWTTYGSRGLGYGGSVAT